MAIMSGSGTVPIGILGDNHLSNITHTVNTTDHLIQGKMLEVSILFDHHESLVYDDTTLKNKLITEMVEKMMHEKCIEFTKQTDPVTNTMRARARVYVTPDSNVRIIREMQK
mgnify:FL=1